MSTSKRKQGRASCPKFNHGEDLTIRVDRPKGVVEFTSEETGEWIRSDLCYMDVAEIC